MKIFITGIAGFLGSHLADRLIDLGHEVSGNDNLIGGFKDNVPKNANFFLTDCCDRDQMTKIMQGTEIVIHTAATAHEGLSIFSPDFITKNIFQASVSCISSAIENNVRRFVYCSSMARYGNQRSPFLETDIPQPVDPYGIAKVAGEDILKSLSKIHKMEWNIAVPHNIIGPRQRYDDPFRNVVSIMINRNLQGKPSIIYGDGEQQRCFSYIDDCIFCLEKLVLEDIIYEVINIGPDENPITIKELASLVANETGLNALPIFMADRPAEVKYATCSSNKARQLLGYETKTDIKTAIKNTADWIKFKGTKDFKYDFPIEIINDLTPKTWANKLI